MKNNLFYLGVSSTGIPYLWALACFYLLFIVSCSSSTNQPNTGETGEKASQSPSSLDPLQGAWDLVWEKSNGKIITNGRTSQFKLFHDGFFSLIMQDSSGKWSTAIAGTYETNGSTYKETVRYSNVPDFVGAMDWQEFKLNGDTLYFKLFTKVLLANGEDVTSKWPKSEEKRVRAKK